LRWKVAIQLAKQCVLVLGRPVGQVVHKLLHLLSARFLQGFRAAEVDGVGLDQNRIELVLADQLAEAVSKLGGNASAVSLDSANRFFLLLL
jgi:hypothetical protein